MVSTAAFYILSAVAVLSALMVVSARNPVHSVLFLILTFFTSAGLFVLIGAEFLAMLLVVVYVGAVAVLFLFVVMMLDIDFVELKQGFLNYLPFGAVVALALFAMFLVAGAGWAESQRAGGIAAAPQEPDITNAEAIGLVLYTDYILVFQLAGMVLFVAMVGAIVLTLRHRQNIKRQSVSAQVARNRATGVAMTNPEIGKGVEL
jgi:NADH-quinone oxidoreductase subunit J